MTRVYHPIGTVSHGTLRSEDLLPVLAQELQDSVESSIWSGMTNWDDAKANYLKLCERAWTLATSEENDTEDEQETISELMDALNDFAPPYAYFGAHEGDGSDFGFWPLLDDESLQDANDSGFRVDVSDHGNVTIYDSENREVWSVV